MNRWTLEPIEGIRMFKSFYTIAIITFLNIYSFANADSIKKVYCGYDINGDIDAIYKDNNVYYDTKKKKKILFLNFENFGVDSVKSTEDNEWVLVTAYSGPRAILFLFNIPHKKYIDLDEYGMLTYWMDKDEG